MKSLLLALLFSLSAQAQNLLEFCPDKVDRIENIQIHQLLSSDNKTCYLGIHPRDAWETLIYRDYLLSSDGLLMIFNSFEPNETPKSTGAREFYFFPKDFSGYQWEVEGSYLKVKGFHGLELTFSLETAQVETLTGAQLKVSPEVVATNMGGVEILSFDKGLFLDAGFLLGESPSSKTQRSSAWRNSKNQECQIRNSESFWYLNGEPTLKTFTELLKVFKKSCPQFETEI